MKPVLTLVFSLFALVGFSQDYTAKFVPESAELCPEEVGEAIARLRDFGSNGSATNYSITTSSPDITLIPLGPPLSGQLPNNSGNVFVDFEIVAAPAASGTYTITATLSCADCSDPDVIATMTVVINYVPEIVLDAFPSTLLCENDSVQLFANVTNQAVNLTYGWSTGESTPAIVATTVNTYSVSVTNVCGQDVESVTLEPGALPIITGQDCNNTGNISITTVFAQDPFNLGLTFQWLEDDLPISSGGDYEIIQIDPLTSQLIISNVNGNNHYLSVYTCEVTNSCGTAVSGGCAAVPVELSYFGAQVLDRDVVVRWGTETESQNEGFYVERSFDGRSFESLGFIAGAGNSQAPIDYTFADKTALQLATSATVYYRLKQVDFDGAFAYTELVTIGLEPGQVFALNQVLALPGQVSVQYFVPQDQPVTIALFDMRGNQIFQVQEEAFGGYHQRTLQTPQLTAGVYFIRLSNGVQTLTEKFFYR